MSSLNIAVAQSIVPDQTLPPNERSQVLPIFPSEDLITGGATRGSNLFHSFRQFNVEAGKGVYFLDPGKIQNIFSRVTGNTRSEIFGTLGAIQIVNGNFAPTNANLFLINPNGIIFGAGARLNLAGSFAATTAPGIQFGDQGSFSAINPTAPGLLTVNPSAFLFNQIAAQPIVVRSLNLDFTKPEDLAILGVNPNRSLLLVGGDVRLEAGLLSANGGRLELGGLAGSGAIGLTTDNARLSLNFSSDSPQSNVAFTQAAGANVTGQDGTISIQAGNLDVLDGSVLFAGINSGTDPTAQAGDIRINTTGTTTIAGSGTVRFATGTLLTRNSNVLNTIGTGSTGNSGNVVIQARSVKIQDSALVGTSVTGIGTAGDLSIQASDRVLVDNAFLNTGVLGDGQGKSGNLNIVGQTLTLNNRALISASSFGQGEAGNVLLQATGAISAKDSTVAATFSGERGKGGNVSIEAGSLLLDNARFNTGTFGHGDAGSIAIRTRDATSLTNGSQISSSVIAFPQFGFVGIGNSGAIQIDAAALSLSGDSTISTLTFGVGNAGSIKIRASDAVRMDNSSIFSDVSLGAIGRGGDTQIQAQSVSLLNRSRLTTGTLGQGDAGHLSVQAKDSIQISGESLVLSAVQAGGIGKAGDVLLQARSLSLSDSARLVTGTFGRGDAGNLSVQAKDSIQLSGDSLISSSVQAGGIGKGGDVTIQTRSLSLTEGSQIQSAIFRSLGGLPPGQGQGGTVRVNALDSIQLSGTNVEGSPSALTTTAEVSTQGRAGDLYVTTPDLTIRDRASIGAETRNADPGGKIVMQVGNLTIANGGRVQTSATNSGNAGTIDVQANSVQLQNGIISADSVQSGGGSIALNARDVRLRDRSLVNTNVAQGASGGGDISINANTFLALEDSDILANANQGRGGNITIRSTAFIADFFSSNRSNSARYTGDLTQFRGNDRVDISASSALGISGTVTIPDFSFLQDNLTQLPQALIDPTTLLADSCIVRNRQAGNFIITGSGGLAARPGDAAIASFSTGEVHALQSEPHKQSRERIVEPQRIYRLSNGQLILSRDCP
ncbi:filamentous hemagglutinin N-terminal domain-containing protein [Leptolyngbya sp. DQ-M1]|uniref:two-partner secretion domain-containing protein n=1 Tax=Leptolyngbya sp. DQ-M1 TaxID=2933920 RepID=UPI003297EEA7